MEIEQTERKIPFRPQKELPIHYKSQLLRKTYIADFVDYEKIIVEIKAINQLSALEEAQLLNYLKATGFEVGLLINFGAEKLQWKRMIHTRKENQGHSRSFA